VVRISRFTEENFGAVQGSSKVFFGNVEASRIISSNNTEIVVEIPSAAQTGLLSVQSQTGLSNSFEFAVVPSSGNIDPISGPEAGGTRVAVIVPVNLGNADFHVLFGSTVAQNAVFIFPNVIVCTSPPGSGTTNVFLSLASITSRIGTFTYLP